jgi:hypothetical protein
MGGKGQLCRLTIVADKNPSRFASQGLGRGQALFQPGDVKDTVFNIQRGKFKAADLRDVQAMAEHQGE